jgi:Methyltransferase domain
MPGEFWTRAGYTARLKPEYFEDMTGTTVWQPDVYADAARVALQVKATRLVDVGCGDGQKLSALSPSYETIGIDHGSNVARARTCHPSLVWREHDLESPHPLPLSEEEVNGAVVVSSDVIEHLLDPHIMLRKLAALLPGVEAIMISTPERDLSNGARHMGPPRNPCHVREWSIREFSAMLMQGGFIHQSIGLTRSNDRENEPYTVLALIAPTAEKLQRLIPIMIDTPALPPASVMGRLRRAGRILIYG